jgi:hypothetical protein
MITNIAATLARLEKLNFTLAPKAYEISKHQFDA